MGEGEVWHLSEAGSPEDDGEGRGCGGCLQMLWTLCASCVVGIALALGLVDIVGQPGDVWRQPRVWFGGLTILSVATFVFVSLNPEKKSAALAFVSNAFNIVGRLSVMSIIALPLTFFSMMPILAFPLLPLSIPAIMLADALGARNRTGLTFVWVSISGALLVLTYPYSSRRRKFRAWAFSLFFLAGTALAGFAGMPAAKRASLLDYSAQPSARILGLVVPLLLLAIWLVPGVVLLVMARRVDAPAPDDKE